MVYELQMFSGSLICLLVRLVFNLFLPVQVTKNLRDIQGPALAIVIERLKPFGALQGVCLNLFIWSKFLA